MSLDRIKRRGLLAELEEELERVRRRLKGIAGSLSDAMFSMDLTHMDTDAKAIEQFAREYAQAQAEGHKLRQQIEELEKL